MSVNTRAPSTIINIKLTGQTEFNIPFEYLARKFVEITLLGVNRLPLVLNTDYRFVSKTLISLTKPYTAEYTQLEIRRVTSASERLVDFHDGSVLRAYDLNLSQIQTLHVAEEARDLTADTIGVNDEGHLDARNRKIVNLAYAENGGDAIPLGQVVGWNDSALNSRDRAEAAAIKAEGHDANAEQSEQESLKWSLESSRHAGNSEMSSLSSATSATASEVAADRSEAAAVRSEAARDSIVQSEANAAASATKAKQEADRAKTEADKLANLNEFAGSLQEVNPTRVTFNRELSAPSLFSRTAGVASPAVGVHRAGVAEMSMTVDASGNQGFVTGEGSQSFTMYWDVTGKQCVSNANENIARGNQKIQGVLTVGYGSNSSTQTYSSGEGTPGGWASNTNWNWYDDKCELGIVRGQATDGRVLLRHNTKGATLDMWMDARNASVEFSASDVGGIFTLNKDGNPWMRWAGETLSERLNRYTPLRWGWTHLCNMPIQEVAVELPVDVRGLRGFFGFIGARGETVFKVMTFPPLDGHFQVNRKGDWQAFELANNGRTLIRRYGWSEGDDPYQFFVETVA